MTVGIVIVSHSPDVAKGAADMVRQMVGNDVPLGFCGGNPELHRVRIQALLKLTARIFERAVP